MGGALPIARLRGRFLSAHVVTPPSMHNSSIILLICWHMLYSISFLLLPLEIWPCRLLCRPAPSSWAWPVSRHAQPACTRPPALHHSSIILMNRRHMQHLICFSLLPSEIWPCCLLCPRWRRLPPSWPWPVSRHAQPACTTPPALHQSSIILLNRRHMLNSMWFLLLCVIIDVQASHLPAPCPVMRSD